MPPLRWQLGVDFSSIFDMGVSENRGTPKWMVKIMENPIKMDDLGVPLFFGNIHMFHVQQVFLTLLTSSCFKQTHNSWVGFFNLVDGKVLDDRTFFSLGKDGGWQQHWAFVQHGSDDCEASRKDPKVDPWIPWVKLGSDSKPRNENFYDSCKDLRNTPIFTSYWYLLLSQNGFLAPPFFQSLRDLQQLISGTL